MAARAWLPLRTRYLPRWHHTGSYQLCPGEQGGGTGTRHELRGIEIPISVCQAPELRKVEDSQFVFLPLPCKLIQPFRKSARAEKKRRLFIFTDTQSGVVRK